VKSTPLYVGLPVAARALGLPRRRVIQLIHRQVLRAKLVERHWWIEAESVEAVLRTRRRGLGGRAA
jgi:hypothetical protein